MHRRRNTITDACGCGFERPFSCRMSGNDALQIMGSTERIWVKKQFTWISSKSDGRVRKAQRREVMCNGQELKVNGLCLHGLGWRDTPRY